MIILETDRLILREFITERNSMRFQKAYIHPVSNEHYLVYEATKVTAESS
ncbi:hypothetical protein [Aquiflexum sp.]